MPDPQGCFVWYELMTTDTEGAKAFYGQVVGWGTRDAPGGLPYTLFTTGEMPVAGLMDLPKEARAMGAPPGWIGYVAVADVDAAADRAKRLGATVHVPPQDIPNIGRFAILADPQRAVFALFRGADSGKYEPPAPGTPGQIGWHELLAADWERAFDFYAALFGWQKADAIDMGGMGTYQLFAAGGPPIGGMFNKPPMVPAPFWLYYFRVGDIDAAAGRVTGGGGQVLNGPMEVPGGDWILNAVDPQGAHFSLHARKA